MKQNDTGTAVVSSTRAIAADELGIEYGVYGDFRMRNLFKTAFTCDGVALTPAAMESVLAPFRNGERSPFADFLDTVAAADRRLVADMLGLLQLANHRHLSASGLPMIFTMEAPARSETAARIFEKLAFMTAEIELGVIRADRLVCQIAAARNTRELLAAADRMRALGIRVALRLGGRDQPDAGTIERLRPDLVRIDRSLIEQAGRSTSTTQLYHSVVAGLQDQGMRVLVEGVDTAQHLDIAIASQADLLQGDHLHCDQAVGCVQDLTAQPLAALRPREAQVIRLFG